MSIQQIKKKIMPILQAYNVRRVGVFGSAVRGELKKDSDIDIVIDISDDISLLEFVRIKQELEKALGRRVDLIEYQTIKPALKQKILNSQVELI